MLLRLKRLGFAGCRLIALEFVSIWRWPALLLVAGGGNALGKEGKPLLLRGFAGCRLIALELGIRCCPALKGVNCCCCTRLPLLAAPPGACNRGVVALEANIRQVLLAT